MSNTNGSMKLSLSARMMRALEAHFEVDDASGALRLDPTLLGLVGLDSDGAWGDTSSVHSSLNLLDLAGKLKAATDAVQADVDQNELDGDNDRALIRSEFAAADAAEATARAAADVTLQDNINAEATARSAGDAALQSNIDAEEAARIAADGVATADRAAIRSEFAAADASIQSELDATQGGAGLGGDGSYTADASSNYIASATSLFEADVALDGSLKVVADGLASEITNRENAVSAEEAARIAADGVLQTAVDAEKARIDAILAASTADADSFAEIVALINSVDTENDQAFAAHVLAYNTRVTAVDAALAAEEAARIAGDAAVTTAFEAADATVQAELDATQSGAGLGVDGSYTVNANGYFIDTAVSIVDSINKLDAGVGEEFDAITQHQIAQDQALVNEVTARTAADTTLQGNIDAEETARIAADGVATTDRAAIRSEFAAADAVIVGDAGLEYNTLGKLEDKLLEEVARAEAVEGDLAGLNPNLANGSLVAAINSIYALSGGNFQGVSAEFDITRSRYYEMQVDGNSGFSHVGPGLFGQISTLADVLNKVPGVGQEFSSFESSVSNAERAEKIYELVAPSLKVFVNGMLVPMKKELDGSFTMNDVRDASEFQFSADGTKVLAPSGFPVTAGEFAVIMLG